MMKYYSLIETTLPVTDLKVEQNDGEVKLTFYCGEIKSTVTASYGALFSLVSQIPLPTKREIIEEPEGGIFSIG